MSTDDWLLVGIAAAFYLLFGLLGWLRPKFWLWRWADVIYYPLAGVGIVLLFFTNDINRSLLRIEADQAAAEQAWRERPNPHPDVAFESGSVSLLEARYGWFDVVRQWGKVCAMSTTEGCSARSKHAEALRATMGDFSIPQEGDAVALARAEEKFCRGGFAYVQRLANESLLSLGAYERLKVALGQISKGQNEAKLSEWLKQTMVAQQRVFASVADEKERAIAAPYIEVEAEHSLALLGRLAWCATRDNSTSQNLKTLDAWQVEETNRAKARARYTRDLESARKNKPLTPIQQASRALQQQWWPYVLLVALSLKFGKATSGIGDDLNGLARRGGSAWLILVRKPRRLRKENSVKAAKGDDPDLTASP